MGQLFGTDGIRGIAYQYPITVEIAQKTGQALAEYLLMQSFPRKIIIGRDTRISGPEIESALTVGINDMGIDVGLTGVIPTPAVAFLTSSLQAGAGIVVSASHNPYHDNGIKLFNKDGFKFSDETENVIEQMILNPSEEPRPNINKTGMIYPVKDADNQYKSFLKKTFKSRKPFENIKIVIDCANGATYKVAPAVFSDLGAEVITLFNSPDGKNINDRCGSQFTQTLAQKVVEKKANIGLAFDGDGDRLITVNEKGVALTGDQILAICANAMKQDGTLKNNLVVSTVMSNMGLGQSLKKIGIHHIKANVGDRYVVEQMRVNGGVLGGEDSGHTVFLDHHTTGDGILTGLFLTEIMSRSSATLSQLSEIMTVFPQVLMNVNVTSKPDLNDIPDIMNAIHMVETRLGEKGRVLVRYSGTEPLCRVMVEAESKKEAMNSCQQLADIIKKAIG